MPRNDGTHEAGGYPGHAESALKGTRMAFSHDHILRAKNLSCLLWCGDMISAEVTEKINTKQPATAKPSPIVISWSAIVIANERLQLTRWRQIVRRASSPYPGCGQVRGGSTEPTAGVCDWSRTHYE